MYSKSLAFSNLQSEGRKEISVCKIVNSAGTRLFAEAFPPSNINLPPNVKLFDGTYLCDGGIDFGGSVEGMLDFGGRVLNWGEIRETLMPSSGDLILSQREQEISTMKIVLNNADKYFSEMLGRENLLEAEVSILIGFSDISSNEFMTQFSGKVNNLTLMADKLSLDVWTI